MPEQKETLREVTLLQTVDDLQEQLREVTSDRDMNENNWQVASLKAATLNKEVKTLTATLEAERSDSNNYEALRFNVAIELGLDGDSREGDILSRASNLRTKSERVKELNTLAQFIADATQ